MKRIISAFVFALVAIALIAGTGFSSEKTKKTANKKSFISLTMNDSSWGDWFQVFFADWSNHDVSTYKHITFYLKNISGGDISKLKIAMADGEKAKEPAVSIADYATIGKKWTKVSIPLSAFQNVDFTKLNSIIIQRDSAPSVTFGLDEIQFDNDEGELPMWTDKTSHTSMQQCGGTQVEYKVEEKGGY